MESSVLRSFRTSEQSLASINTALLPPAADTAAAQQAVDAIIARVRAEGDAAVLDLTRQFDWAGATLEGLRVTEEELDRSMSAVEGDLLGAMTMAAEHIRRYHTSQMPADFMGEYDPGLRLGQRHTPLDSVACYVPTRKASIPSSLLMSVVPAQVAGVKRIAVAAPCGPDGALPAGVLAAAHLLGVTEVYKLGGAVAMAALALGTETFPRVDKIVGPANIYGTLAKKSLFGEVGIDGLYGPSEVAIIADGSAPTAWMAMDMLSQSEHGEDSQSVLVTPNEDYARAVEAEVARLLAASPRADYLRKSLAAHGAIILTRDLDEAAAMANLLASEHLELAVADPHALLPRIRHAGAIFLGACTTVPVGDYFAGPSHVLPTGRTARFSSGLGVTDFLVRSSLIEVTQGWMAYHAPQITTFADHEGLDAHAEAVRMRAE